MDIKIQNLQGTEAEYVPCTESENVANPESQVINPEAELVMSTIDAMKTEEQKEQEERMACLVEQHRVSILTPYPEEECLLMIDGVPFFAKGDIHAIKAKQKHGKTNTVAIMAAAILKGQVFRLEACQPNAKVVIIDTEQKPADTQSIYRKVLELSGLPMEDRFDRLQVYTLRTMSPAERGQAVKDIVEVENPDILFLDGIVDLSCDFNEVSDSQTLINMLMQLSTDHKCAIVNILHTNKAQTDHNMRGHLGTMLAQKAGNVLECVKSADNVVTVKSADSRHAPIPEWSFSFAEDGSLECADERARIAEIEKARTKAEQAAIEKTRTLNNHLEICKSIFAETVGFITVAELKKQYQMKSGASISTTRNHILELLTEKRLIEESGVVRLATNEEMNRE